MCSATGLNAALWKQRSSLRTIPELFLFDLVDSGGRHGGIETAGFGGQLLAAPLGLHGGCLWM